MGLAEIMAVAKIAKHYGLESLELLTLKADCRERQEVSQLDGTVNHLLRALRPLQALRLSGYVFDESFCAALEHHGKTLRELALRCCPDLEVVKPITPRTMGDKNEVAIYRALAGLRRLKRVSLILYCRIIYSEDERHGRLLIQDLFVNYALDATLTRLIFRVM